MLRQPAVADRFYPGSPATLSRTISELLPDTPLEPQEALAVVCPHAGYVYSGQLAGRTIASVAVPETVIILGPNHHGQGAPVALSMADWKLPQGVVPCNREVAEQLLAASDYLTEDEAAHRLEHSLEVQVPFLQHFRNDLRIVAISVSQVSYPVCRDVGTALATVIAGLQQRPLLLASSDMTHYESRASATSKDSRALDRISALDPEGLYETVLGNRISMCGVIPVAITLVAAKQLGATKARLVGYTDSGAVSGDTDQVVGYAGIVIS